MKGPYTVKIKCLTLLMIWCVTMIDPATSWFDHKEIQNKEAHNVPNVVK
jgi:hypothetical protein